MYTMPASWWTVEMFPVLCATLASPGTPAGIPLLARVSSMISSICAHTSGEYARPSAIMRSSRSTPLAVTRLLMPAWKAVSSETPRTMTMPSTRSSSRHALDGLDPHHVDEQVGGEVARPGDHLVGEVVHGHGASDPLLHLGVHGAGGDSEGLAVHDAGEAVAHVHRGVGGQLAARDLGVDADEDGDLDRGRGVEQGVGVEGPLQRGLGVVERDPEALQAVDLLEAQDAVVEGPLHGGQRLLGGLRRRPEGGRRARRGQCVDSRDQGIARPFRLFRFRSNSRLPPKRNQ